MNTYLRLEIRVVKGEFFNLKKHKCNDSLYVFVYNQKYLNPAFKTGFSVLNNHLNLCWRQRILIGNCVVEK